VRGSFPCPFRVDPWLYDSQLLAIEFRRSAKASTLLFGYNTNGFAHHQLEDILTILAEFGYGSVALTLDHHVLNPFEADLPRRTAQVRGWLDQHHMRCVVETGARFLLDPRRKHQPTLLSPTEADRQRRLDFLCRAVDIARDLGADAVSFWSGSSVDHASDQELWRRLLEGTNRLCDYAGPKGVRLAFEPEPGMFIDTMDKFAQFVDDLARPELGLTLDVGHLHCQGEIPLEDHVRRWRDRLWNVHIEDMRKGVHDHLMFGEGEMDFPPLLACFREIGYCGGLHVELSRHSYDAVETARRAIKFLSEPPA
jgi:sugar phosphate isomerase/epimerase